MAVAIRWIGHSAYSVDIDGHKLLIDPFVSGNPVAKAAANELEAEVILLTHAHGDHVGDSVEMGIDMFDCVLPTRNGRHGRIFTTFGEVNLTAARWKNSHEPIDAHNESAVSRSFSRGYLRHLFSVGESLGGRLATLHNLSFYGKLMKGMRRSIEEGTFADFKADFEMKYTAGE